MSQIEILLADDHAVMRTGLRLVLERQQDFHVVAEASDGREAVALALQHKPDVVVMDVDHAQFERHRGGAADWRSPAPDFAL